MQNRERIMLCVMPYVAAGYMWFSLTNPALVSGQDTNDRLEEKRKEKDELQMKLGNLGRLEKEKKQLESAISDLRGSVPKSPDTDILLIDLERMALDSGIEVIGIEPPEKEKQKKAEEELALSAGGMSMPTATTVGGLRKELTAPQAAKPGAPAKGKQAEPVDTGLNTLVRQVTVTGNYPNVIEFMRKLESYQRVIGINQIEVEVPAEVGKKKVQEVRHLIISFLMTAYYLP